VFIIKFYTMKVFHFKQNYTCVIVVAENKKQAIQLFNSESGRKFHPLLWDLTIHEVPYINIYDEA